jgi:hypothetical protein
VGIIVINFIKKCIQYLFSGLSSYVDEIIGDHQCGFGRIKSIYDQVFCIRQTLEKKWEYNETVHKLDTDFKKAYDSVRRKVLNNIRIKFRGPLKLVRLINMCLNETYSKVHIGEYLSDSFLMQLV